MLWTSKSNYVINYGLKYGTWYIYVKLCYDLVKPCDMWWMIDVFFNVELICCLTLFSYVLFTTYVSSEFNSLLASYWTDKVWFMRSYKRLIEQWWGWKGLVIRSLFSDICMFRTAIIVDICWEVLKWLCNVNWAFNLVLYGNKVLIGSMGLVTPLCLYISMWIRWYASKALV